MLTSFLFASLISLTLIVVCVVAFYEILAHAWLWLPKLDGRPALQILVTILAAFVAHTIAIWIFGVTYFVLVNHTGFGALIGEGTHELLAYVYFSGVTYSSLGFGDVYPSGDLRLIVAAEAILGLILIGWTIAFTYIFTEKYLIHKRERHQGKRR